MSSCGRRQGSHRGKCDTVPNLMRIGNVIVAPFCSPPPLPPSEKEGRPAPFGAIRGTGGKGGASLTGAICAAMRENGERT